MMRDVYSNWGIAAAVAAFTLFGISFYTGNWYWTLAYYVLGVLSLTIWCGVTALREFSDPKKMPWWVDVLLVLIIPIGFPFSFLVSIYTCLREKHIDKTTVRGIFKKYHQEHRPENKGLTQLDKEHQIQEADRLMLFFEETPHLFEGLPGDLFDIRTSKRYCSFLLRTGEYSAENYHVSWDDVPELMYELHVWSNQKGLLK